MQVLPDGTYLAELKPPRKSDGPPVTVRVVEYTVHTTAGDGGEQSRPRKCSAWSLTCSTSRSTRRWTWPARTPRWGCETVIGHHKTDMGQPVLRSGDPEGVMQEMWALFAVHQAISRLAGIAMTAAGIPRTRSAFRTP